ncbi:Acetyltransferase [Kitasatospora sp. MMS16-BH015]|uniref:GNAT family N-acetyltransferase n=1 Tax=Kitasatospora sp. MMS16-BH015 TaxID=2018025 RepID=UPI000CA10A2C|nr:GNAT family N-acetyltransferase [Kitasatospora sp. MMS16-BH015]AUG80090.1 Acetyltransferase [Kitasatospora sp. MMS16-BH015]
MSATIRSATRTTSPPHLLDNPVWAALAGPHAHLAERHGRAARYPAEVSPFAALADPADPQAWADLAELVGPGGLAALTGLLDPPPGWRLEDTIPGVQLVATALRTEPLPGATALRTEPLPGATGFGPEPALEAVRLGPADVPEMLDLIKRTQPGPFLPRTVELGGYLGLRVAGRLVAMAGQRLHPPGWTEISAVCTDPAHRGRGLATRLVRAVAHGIRERGDTPFLHTSAANTTAIRLYESIGFTLRRRPDFLLLRAPGTAPDRPGTAPDRPGTAAEQERAR